MRSWLRWLVSVVLLVFIAVACAGGQTPAERAWLAVEILPNGDAVLSLAAPDDVKGPGRLVSEAAATLFPSGSAGTPTTLEGGRVSVAVTGAVVPGPSPAFVVDATALPQPIATDGDAVEVCMPGVDIIAEVSRGSPPTLSDGCYVLLREQVVRFTMYPEGWRLPASLLGAGAAVFLAILAWRSRTPAAPWLAAASLLAVVTTVLAASDAATAALLAGVGGRGPVVPAWLISRLALAAAAVLATVVLTRAVRRSGRNVRSA